MPVDAFLLLRRHEIIDFLESNRIPAMFSHREFALAGGLMSYSASQPDLFRRSATYVHKILQGSQPSDLPVEQPTKFDLVLNLKTAKTLGLHSANVARHRRRGDRIAFRSAECPLLALCGHPNALS